MEKAGVKNSFDIVFALRRLFPIGLILCAEGSKEQIELLQLEKSGIRVAEYLVELPSKELLQRKLHRVVELEKQRIKMNKLK